ncbi:MAG: hypothetical protein HC880_17565 [Bacteroidia bacterium]|nr:hypothetical protein [Bacteroidia bacterium]
MLDNLLIKTGNSRIAGDVKLTYPDLSTVANNLSQVGLDINLSDTRIAYQDMLYFVPSLAQENFFRQHQSETMLLEAHIQGAVDNLEIDELLVKVSGQNLPYRQRDSAGPARYGATLCRPRRRSLGHATGTGLFCTLQCTFTRPL